MLLYNDEYGPGREEEASKKISVLLTVSNIITIPIVILFGYAADRIKMWKVLTVCLLLCMISYGWFIFLVGDIGFQQDLVYIFMSNANICLYLSVTSTRP